MIAYLPHTDEDIRLMLETVGVAEIEQLFADIPRDLIIKRPLEIPQGIPEYEVYRRMQDLAARNQVQPVSFLGCGSYDHIVPAVVSHVLSRSEFYSSYTPYQAEMSQGFLQAIFEFQSMICELTGLEVANASLYDGHTAVSEAAVLALNSVRHSDTILVSGTLHPFTRQVLRTHFSNLPVHLEEIPGKEGTTDPQELGARLRPGVAAVVLQSPNVFGYVEDLSGLAEEVHANGALLVVSANPLSLGVLKPPGDWGADIAVGDTQPLGLSTYFGGPSAGYITATEKLLRKMPGRIAGQSLDRDGRRAFLLTLQAREQHIKRERATSNICSNQALAALATTVYLAALGKRGIREVAEQNLRKAHYLQTRLLEATNAEALFARPFFNEFPIVLPKRAAEVLPRMEESGFYAGVDLHRLDPTVSDRTMLVAVTERRTREEMDRYVKALKEVLR
ncbi:MAG: aminomethyl-transferring glycine dehydrogenase subunit GcvPA [Spirochaetaceae bacterium]|nr:MAG: aminomethyl-transferring glycine dehydrogenase subunit GcvPA [Spirochaetaceae bacterium]